MKATRPSDTAKLIARSILLASRDRHLQSLVAEGEAELLHLLLTSDQGRDWLISALKLAPIRGLLLRLERVLLPGIITHYLARKRQIEAQIEQVIASGCQRVVVIAAGHDTLAWRLHLKHPEVDFVELDHPATQQVKGKELGNARNFHLHPIDLVAELPSSALSEVTSTQTHSTAFVVEGLTMYLPARRVAELLQDLSMLAGSKGSIVFTFMEQSESGSIAFRGENPLIARWLHARSEPFLWGISRDELPDFLQSSQLQLLQLDDHKVLRRDQLAPRAIDRLPLAEGELICTACPIYR